MTYSAAILPIQLKLTGVVEDGFFLSDGVHSVLRAIKNDIFRCYTLILFIVQSEVMN